MTNALYNDTSIIMVYYVLSTYEFSLSVIFNFK